MGGVLIGGIISPLAERLKGQYLAEGVVRCLVFATVLMCPKYLSTWFGDLSFKSLVPYGQISSNQLNYRIYLMKIN